MVSTYCLTARRSWVLFWVRAFLCGICMVTLWLCGFSLGTLASSHSPKTCQLWVRLIVTLNCQHRYECVWMVVCLYMSALQQTDDLAMVFPWRCSDKLQKMDGLLCTFCIIYLQMQVLQGNLFTTIGTCSLEFFVFVLLEKKLILSGQQLSKRHLRLKFINIYFTMLGKSRKSVNIPIWQKSVIFVLVSVLL